jgi:hypothetical protein
MFGIALSLRRAQHSDMATPEVRQAVEHGQADYRFEAFRKAAVAA